MSDADDRTPAAPLSGEDCPLPVAQQRRNILLYGAIWALYYLSAPITYVSIAHAHILHKELGTSQFLANLPSSAYLWVTALGAIVVAQFFPQPRLARRLVVSGLIGIAAISGLVALAFALPLPKSVWIGMVVAHGFILGICSGGSFPAMWDMVRRGVSTSRRGALMGLAFGAGPVFACVGSLLQQWILHGTVLGFTLGTLPFPGNCVLLFGAFAPVMLLGAVMAGSMVLPDLSGAEASDAPTGTEVVSGFREFVASRSVYLGVICYVLAYMGLSIMPTVSLDASDSAKKGESTVTSSAEKRAKESPAPAAAHSAGTKPDASAKSSDSGTTGYQNLLRFGFKAIAGVLLGWLLARTNPRAGILATTTILIAGILWALTVSGFWKIISLGILGAGELFGTYYPNYVVTASLKRRVRLHIAYLSLASAVVGFAPIVFGLLTDKTKSPTVSMWLAVGLLVLTNVIILARLPKDSASNRAGGRGGPVSDGPLSGESLEVLWHSTRARSE